MKIPHRRIPLASAMKVSVIIQLKKIALMIYRCLESQKNQMIYIDRNKNKILLLFLNFEKMK